MGKERQTQVNDAEYYGGSYYYTPQPPEPNSRHDNHHHHPPPPPKGSRAWFSWLIPLIFIIDVFLFGYTMYVNNCPETYSPASQCLFEEDLGRYSFLPLSVNPLLGPSTSTLEKLGGLMLELVQHGQSWRLFTCMWLHAGVIHLLSNMLSLLFIGISLEQEFGFLRLGALYVISGIGGSLSSCLHILEESKGVAYVSVGASGALFGLLGSMLSELITNWTVYANKCAALSSLVIVIGLNLAFGLIPGVDNSAHIGGFVSGFFLGFVLLMRPQYGYVSSKYLPSRHATDSKMSKYKCYQYFFFVVSLIILAIGYAVSFAMVLGSLSPYKASMINKSNGP